MKLSKSKLYLIAASVFAAVTCLLIFADKKNAKPSAKGAELVAEQDISQKSNDKIIEIKDKLFISQVNDVYLNPDEYMGRTIKIEGLFKSERNPQTDQQYSYVLRYGPGCCGSDGNVGFEVAYKAPQVSADSSAYPKEDAWVEAVGVLDSYTEDGYPYIYLKINSLNEKSQRGNEFVTQ